MGAGKAERILKVLSRHYGPEPRNWHTRQDAFKVLISTVLSQRTRDENTDRAARALFSRYSTPEELAGAGIKSIEGLIRPAGFYRQKAPRVKEIAKTIIVQYGGKVPDNIEELLKLPGVGRKTANCVLVYGHGRPAIPVDVHVHRVSNRLGIVKTTKPEQTEKELTKIIPKRSWLVVNRLFVIHGQSICRPASPKCGECPVNKYCSYFKTSYAVKR